MAIETVKEGWAAALLRGRTPRDMPPEIVKRAKRRLASLSDAVLLSDLGAPGFRLPALQGDRAGFWAIAVDRQWRVIFRWDDGRAYDGDIVDYH